MKDVRCRRLTGIDGDHLAISEAFEIDPFRVGEQRRCIERGARGLQVQSTEHVDAGDAISVRLEDAPQFVDAC